MEKFYMCLAAGGQVTTARTIKQPYILINYMTQTNKHPKYDIESLFIDCGGFYSSFEHGGYITPDIDYLEYVNKMNADLFALRDYPCEPELLKKHNRTPKKHIEMTLDNHLSILELMDVYYVNAKPIPVIQGWDVTDYLYCIDLFKDHDLITDYMAIGSVCRRNAIPQIKEVVLAIRNELPKTKLHGFGLKRSALKDLEIYRSLYSVDSGAYDFPAKWKKLRGKFTAREASLYFTLKYKREMYELMEHNNKLLENEENQKVLV